MKEVVYNSAGAIIAEIDHPAAPTKPKLLRPDEVLDLIPATVVKALEESTVAAVIKRYACFKLKPSWTKTEGTSLFTDMVNATLMTSDQKTAALAAWPEE